VGKKVAKAILDWRQADGFDTANPQPPAFLPSTLPGIWRQTTAGPAGAAQFSELGSVVPFGLLTSTQFLPTVFPQLESAEYATDFNEVRSKGQSTSTTRTAEQTRFAQLFAGVGPFVNVTNPFRLWNNVARDVADEKGYGLAATARLFALLNASVFDSLQTSQGIGCGGLSPRSTRQRATTMTRPKRRPVGRRCSERHPIPRTRATCSASAPVRRAC
jgi:hypothetical protein